MYPLRVVGTWTHVSWRRHVSMAGTFRRKNGMHFLDFEKPIAELEGKIAELKHMSDGDGINIAEEIGRLQNRVEKDLRSAYAKLSPWQKTQVARHQDRPHTVDFIKALI